MQYKEITVTLTPYSEAIADALIGEFSTIGFDGFYNTENGFVAYIPTSDFKPEAIETLDYWNLISTTHTLSWTEQTIEDQDWNAVWESNFSPITIDNTIMVRAGFHEPNPQAQYDIVIDPKMSFGTGHHSTTALVLRTLLQKESEIKGMRVLDMGCGTGILGIMASLLGAKEVLGIDIDEWAYNNAIENIKTNEVPNMTIKIGDASLLANEQPFDVVLANINRNILLEDMKHYVAVMHPGSLIIFSGFYEQDLDKIKEEADKQGLSFDQYMENEEWVAATFYKK
ncbi:MAG: 50S ribosomal protein L11 methyltransferase [Marinifilaceae bacterium]